MNKILIQYDDCGFKIHHNDKVFENDFCSLMRLHDIKVFAKFLRSLGHEVELEMIKWCDCRSPLCEECNYVDSVDIDVDLDREG
jgi:hypothetical protein